MGYSLYPYACPQEEQAEDEQDPQELSPPPMGVETPPESLENEAKADMARLAFLLHLGHSASSSHRLMGRRRSNLSPQSKQEYS